MKRFILLIATLFLIYGCAAPLELTREQRAILDTPVICGPTDTPVSVPVTNNNKSGITSVNTIGNCEDAWGKTIYWITAHSSWKIQQQTNNIIMTFGPGDSINPAFSASKLPRGNGINEIIMTIRCGNAFGCAQSPVLLLINYTNYMSAKPASFSQENK